MENADLGLQYCSIFSVDIPPDFQILTPIVGQIPVGVVGADSGHGLTSFFQLSVEGYRIPFSVPSLFQGDYQLYGFASVYFLFSPVSLCQTTFIFPRMVIS